MNNRGFNTRGSSIPRFIDAQGLPTSLILEINYLKGHNDFLNYGNNPLFRVVFSSAAQDDGSQVFVTQLGADLSSKRWE